MKQVLVKGGQIIVETIPVPAVEPRTALVRVVHSCISAGTELSGIKASGVPLHKRVFRQPDLIKKGLKMVAETGLRRTFNVAKGKIETGNQTGYSAAGIVEETGTELLGIKPGMRVACAGAGIANHAEYICVPRNLLTPVPDEVDLASASTVTLGAIALQGIRRAQPTLGETFVVFGLGILGQLAVQLFKANGCRVIGVDLDADRLDLASQMGADNTISPLDKDPISSVHRITGGHGADGVLVTAASASHEVLSTAFQMCRKKGRVVLVGDVGLNINRADIYEKELDFLVSTSYGPGRYDDRYEKQGLDYPIGYVRWTENRNMSEYLQLIAGGKLQIEPLISGVYPVEKASEAYKSFETAEKRPLMVLLSYSEEKKEARRTLSISTATPKKTGQIGLAVIGAGGFAKGMHLPNLKKLKDLYTIEAIVSRSGANAVATARQFEVPVATTDYNEILSNDKVDAVLIATRHNMHVAMAKAALEAGKHVLVEKPLALNRAELEELIGAYEKIPEKSRPVFTVGYNRRFSRYAQAVKEAIADRVGPLVVVYRMNAGYIPAEHWVQGPEGGGRNIGEGCHIYDLFNYLTGAKVAKITSSGMASGTEENLPNENFATTIEYDDGSICTLVYTSVGHGDYPKEQFEVFVDGKVIVLEDYKKMDFYGSKHKSVTSTISEKGQLEELRAFVQAIKDGRLPIPFEQLVQASEISFEAEELMSR